MSKYQLNVVNLRAAEHTKNWAARGMTSRIRSYKHFNDLWEKKLKTAL
jgi:hypothetical protein